MFGILSFFFTFGFYFDEDKCISIKCAFKEYKSNFNAKWIEKQTMQRKELLCECVCVCMCMCRFRCVLLFLFLLVAKTFSTPKSCSKKKLKCMMVFHQSHILRWEWMYLINSVMRECSAGNSAANDNEQRWWNKTAKRQTVYKCIHFYMCMIHPNAFSIHLQLIKCLAIFNYF